jgi:hypothetical protein
LLPTPDLCKISSSTLFTSAFAIQHSEFDYG